MFLVYSLFTSILGQNGYYARKHLEAERLQLIENYWDLERTNADFLRIRESLRHDQDALSVYARQLGYGRQGEEFIRIMGLGIAINTNMPTGQALYAANPVYISDKIIKIISISFGMIVLLFFLIMDFLSFKIIDE